MKTTHRIMQGDSRQMSWLSDESVDLIVTSPPYPMIRMWDATFRSLDSTIAEFLDDGSSWQAFEGMHKVLDNVWRECFRIVKPGGFVCINIGDATRRIGDDFRRFPNRTWIESSLVRSGLTPLTAIHWWKRNNSPTKFMGSGMLPAGAYVTNEHEFILIFRKSGKREFKSESEKLRRRESAYFREERNTWFADPWIDIKGTSQEIPGSRTRTRSGAFSIELPHRLIQMYSVLGDTVLDPFLGTGTTLTAAAASGRNSLGVEIDSSFCEVSRTRMPSVVAVGRRIAEGRLAAHKRFVLESDDSERALRHENHHYGFPVMTSQEVDLVLYRPSRLTSQDDTFEVEYVVAEAPLTETQLQLI